MYTVQDYKDGNFPFPNMDVEPEKKSTAEYTKAVGEAIYSRYVKGKTGVSRSYQSLFDDLRNYGRGLQSEDIYKSHLSSPDSDSASASGVSDIDGSWTSKRSYERKGWMNVLWDIISPAVKIRDTIHGLFDDIDFNIIADAIDADSGAEEEDRKWKLWAETRPFIQGELARLYSQAGIPQDTKDFIPDNLTELEMYQEAGGFKVAYSLTLEKLLKHTENISGWDSKLKKKLLDDIIDINICACRCVHDENANKIKWEYVDPAMLVIQYSREEGYDDSEFAGQIREVKVSDLRASLLRWGYKEEDVRNVAEQSCGYFGNPDKAEWEQYNKLSPTGSFLYDDFKTEVFTFEWIDREKDREIKYTNKFGKVRFLKYTPGKKVGNRGEVVTTTDQYLYQGTWVIGTGYCYDYGKAYYQPRPAPNTVSLTYRVVQLEGKSLTARLVPIYDNVQISWLKYQNALSAIFEEGYAVDWRMISNISDGKETMSAQAAVKMWRESGILPFMSTPVGQFYRGGAVLPAHKLPGGMGTALNDAIGRLQHQLQLIEMITGLSPISLGMRPDPNAPVGTSERSLESTHNALKPMIKGIFEVKNGLSRVTAPRIQQLVRYDNDARGAYENVVGATDVKNLADAKDSNVQYGIKLEARPTTQEKTHILRAAELALAPGRNGMPGIEYSDYMYIIERLYAGANLKELRLYLVSAKKRAKRRAYAEQMQMQQQKAQNDAALEKQRMEKEALKVRLDTESKLAVEKAKSDNAIREKVVEENQQYARHLAEIAAKEVERGGVRND